MAGKRVSVCKKRVILLLTDTAKSSPMAELSTLIKQMAPGGRTWRCSLFLSTWACSYSTPICTVGHLGNGMQVAVSPPHPCLQMHWGGKGSLLLRKLERESERSWLWRSCVLELASGSKTDPLCTLDQNLLISLSLLSGLECFRLINTTYYAKTSLSAPTHISQLSKPK